MPYIYIELIEHKFRERVYRYLQRGGGNFFTARKLKREI